MSEIEQVVDPGNGIHSFTADPEASVLDRGVRGALRWMREATTTSAFGSPPGVRLESGAGERQRTSIMLKSLSSRSRQPLGRGQFRIQRIRPGRILDRDEGDDLGFGPLSVIDHATLGEGALVAMHEHVNDEILSYLWTGEMVHRDTTGKEVLVSAARLMLMNAGAGFQHEEAVPRGRVEMLQIFVRPSAADLEPLVQFFDNAPPTDTTSTWRSIAGPAGGEAPLSFRQRVWAFDAMLREGEEIAGPQTAEKGLSPWIYILDGSLILGGASYSTGDALTWDSGEPSPRLRATSHVTLVGFLVDLNAPSSRAGTISGR